METQAASECNCNWNPDGNCNCDRRLLAQLVAADPALRRQGWETWYCRDAPALMAFLNRRCRRLGWDEQSEDLLQDCFLIAVRRIAGGGYIEQGEGLIAYLLGIAKNLLRNLYRRQRRAPVVLGDQELVESVEAAADGLDASDSVFVAEVIIRVGEACTQRPDAHRLVIAGIYGEGKSAEQLAAELGKSAGNVRLMAHRAVHEIACHLEGRYHMRLSLAAIRACLAMAPGGC